MSDVNGSDRRPTGREQVSKVSSSMVCSIRAHKHGQHGGNWYQKFWAKKKPRRSGAKSLNLLLCVFQFDTLGFKVGLDAFQNRTLCIVICSL